MQLNIENSVTILMNRPDVNNLINMSDVFILPSLWEGLPFTGVEAQANGIPCIFSDTISEELKISDVYNTLSIKEPAAIWAEKIIEMFGYSRKNTTEQIKENGFDIKDVCEFIEKKYEE